MMDGRLVEIEFSVSSKHRPRTTEMFVGWRWTGCGWGVVA
jgi:hypothetical protein